MRTSLLAAVIALSLVACKPAPSKQKAPAEAKAAALANLGKKPLPALTADKITYKGPPLTPVRGSIGNTVMFPLESLRQLDSAYLGSPSLFTPPSSVQQPLAWIAAGAQPSDIKTDHADEVYGSLARAEYVLLIKTVSWNKPAGGGDTFKPGAFRGEAHLVDMTGKHYGGVRFSGASSDSVTVNTRTNTQTGKSFTNDEGVLTGDLRDAAWADLSEKLKTQLPDSTFELR